MSCATSIRRLGLAAASLVGFSLLADAALAQAPSGGGALSAGARAAMAAQGSSASAALRELDTLQRAVTDAWTRMPLTQRRAIFVAEKPELYGAYTERKSNVFAPGEPLVTYVEPVGYTWAAVADGEVEFGVTVDFTLKTPDGKILGGQEGFANTVLRSRYKNQEFMLTLTLNASGLTAGDYVLAYTLHDRGSTKTSSFEQPFKIGG